jgi:hypothetical protein
MPAAIVTAAAAEYERAIRVETARATGGDYVLSGIPDQQLTVVTRVSPGTVAVAELTVPPRSRGGWVTGPVRVRASRGKHPFAHGIERAENGARAAGRDAYRKAMSG